MILKKIAAIIFCLLIALPIFAETEGGAFWTWAAPGDACLTLSTAPDISGDGLPEIVAGMDSGNVVCLSSEPTSPAQVLWTADVNGGVLALLTVSMADEASSTGIIAATNLGWIVLLRAQGAQTGSEVWSYKTSCNISALCSVGDRNGDGWEEIAAGGGDQRVYLLNGATGLPIWTTALGGISGGGGYVHAILNAGDLNDDSAPDIFVRTWEDSKIRALNGATGAILWSSNVAGNYTDPLAVMGDINDDGRMDFITGGNDKILKLCTGSTGAAFATYEMPRPLRSVIAVGDVDGDGKSEGVGAAAGGEIVCISSKSVGKATALWTAKVEGVCRNLAAAGDLDEDGKPDVCVSTEEGIVAAISGADGRIIWQWQGADVARPILATGDADGDGKNDIAVGCLDGSVALLSGEAKHHKTRTAPLRINPPHRVAPPKPVRSAESTRGANSVPILLYHDVLPEMFYYYGVSLDNFRAQMDTIVEGKFTCVTLDQIADWIEGKAELPENPICITFDGPYDGQFTYAYPVMKERGLFATVYCTSDWIGTANHTDWHQMRKMDAGGIEDIQNHSMNHANLTSLSEDQVTSQLLVCNESIKRLMNGKIASHHAYPGGYNNATVMNHLRKLGFRTATTVVQRHVVKWDNLMALPRYSVDKTTTIEQFRQKIGYSVPTPTPTPEPSPIPSLPYDFAGNVGSDWAQPSFADVDTSGRLWICDYTNKNVRIFEENGTEVSFSPIKYGLSQKGSTIEMEAPSGIAITPTGEALVSIADYFGTSQYLGILRFKTSDGAPLNGFDLDYVVGDVDCDSKGYIYAVDKTVFFWHVYTPQGVEIQNSPIGPGTTDHIQRGISVLPDSSRVYVISEADSAVHVWTGASDENGAAYTKAANLGAGRYINGGGVDVMDDGTVLVSDGANNRVLAFDSEHTLVGMLRDAAAPVIRDPRGCAFKPDGSVIWVILRSGKSVQRWNRRNTKAAGVIVY